jgi:hypothetical protein
MSSTGSESLLCIEPRASTRARGLVVLLCAVVVLVSGWTLPVSTALVVIAAVTAALVMEWRGSRPPGGLLWDGAGEWWIDDDGPWRLHSSSVRSSLLVVLVLEDEHRRSRVALLPDSLPAEQWRRLRARLRRQAAEAPGWKGQEHRTN